MKRRGFVLVPVLVLSAAGLMARAEVSARLDDTGEYAGMHVRYAGGNPPRIWTAGVPTATRRPLNPTGDILGDLAPTVLENPADRNYPWVVWSHPNGTDVDLIFSRWTGSGWNPPQFVQTDNFFDDLDPRLVFTSRGRAYMVWWTNEGGTGVVSFSMFLASRWMTPLEISSGGIDSRRPALTLDDDLHVVVTYETPSGREVRTLTLPGRDTITDDVDPKIRAEISVE